MNEVRAQPLHRHPAGPLPVAEGRPLPTAVSLPNQKSEILNQKSPPILRPLTPARPSLIIDVLPRFPGG
jgi:hypothetical protein